MPSPKRPGPLDFSRRENFVVLVALLGLLLVLLLVPLGRRVLRQTPVRKGGPRPSIEYLTGVTRRGDRFSLLPGRPASPEIRSALALHRDGYLEQAAVLLRGRLQETAPPAVRLSLLVNLANLLDDMGDTAQAAHYYREALGLAPKNPYIRYNHGVFLYHAGQTREAAAEFAKALRFKPAFDRAILNLGNIHFELGDLKTAIRWYDRMPHRSDLRRQADYNTAMTLWRIDPAANAKTIERLLTGLLSRRDTVAYFAAVNLAHLHAGRGDLAAAREDLLTAVAINTQFFTAWYNLGLLEKESRNFDRAILYLQKAMERRRDTRDLRRHMADLYYGQGPAAPGILLLERLVAETNDLSAVALLADLYYENGPSTWSDALDLYADMIRSGNEAERLVALGNSGNIWFGRGDFAKAGRFYSEALKLAPTDVRIHFNLGLALARMGRSQEALDTFLKVLALQPDHAGAVANIILLNASLNRIPQAVELCEDYLAREGPEARFLLLLATLHLRSKNYDKAWEALDRLQTQDPDLQASSATYRGFIALRKGDLRQALSWYDRALALRPQDSSLLLAKSIVLGRLQDVEESLRVLTAAINLTQDGRILARAYLHQGNLLYRRGDYAAAARSYERALEYDPSSFEAHHNLGLLKRNIR